MEENITGSWQSNILDSVISNIACVTSRLCLCVTGGNRSLTLCHWSVLPNSQCITLWSLLLIPLCVCVCVRRGVWCGHYLMIKCQMCWHRPVCWQLKMCCDRFALFHLLNHVLINKKNYGWKLNCCINIWMNLLLHSVDTDTVFYVCAYKKTLIQRTWDFHVRVSRPWCPSTFPPCTHTHMRSAGQTYGPLCTLCPYCCPVWFPPPQWSPQGSGHLHRLPPLINQSLGGHYRPPPFVSGPPAGCH